MLKKWIFYVSIITIVGFLSSGFKPFKTDNYNWFQANQNEDLDYLLPSLKPENYAPTSIPFTGKFFIAFKEAVGFKESQGHYNKINSLGYLGKYQFGVQTLKTIGITDSLKFINTPKLQEKAFVALIKRNKWELKDEIERYSGKIIGGVKITESGILASAHLGGTGSVKKFLKSNGRNKCSDAYGSSVKSYMKQFSGYETTGIVADSNASVR
ncbi:MAG: peptidoglycan-binding protein LysM [Flavobacterium sp.]|nr:peptidoglycan-binding protein LysM [Flavobacterium sp.]